MKIENRNRLDKSFIYELVQYYITTGNLEAAAILWPAFKTYCYDYNDIETDRILYKQVKHFEEHYINLALLAFNKKNYEECFVNMERAMNFAAYYHWPDSLFETYFVSMLHVKRPQSCGRMAIEIYDKYSVLWTAIMAKKDEGNQNFTTDENNITKLYFYHNKKTVSFGKYKGYTIEELIRTDSGDILDCIINLTHFALVWRDLIELVSDDDKFYTALETNLAKYYISRETNYFDWRNKEEYDPYKDSKYLDTLYKQAFEIFDD